MACSRYAAACRCAERAADLLGLANRFLPGPGGIYTHQAKGKESESPLSSSWLTTLSDQAAERMTRDVGAVEPFLLQPVPEPGGRVSRPEPLQGAEPRQVDHAHVVIPEERQHGTPPAAGGRQPVNEDERFS